MTADLQLTSLSKRFDTDIALESVSLTVSAGEYVTMLGPSGSGKSTTLRLVAGLETPDSGTVAIRGVDVTALPPHRRDCAMVFQHYALFPHLTVADNISFGPRMRGAGRSEAAAGAQRLLDLVALGGQGNKWPRQLSGGQQQRVGLARALAVKPAILLLDEPLGALDLSLRHQMQGELRAIQRESGCAFLHVTHDQHEALVLSDRVVVMNKGRIAQIGTPEEIHERPESRFVAEFMGFRNFLPARADAERWVSILGQELVSPDISGPGREVVVAAIRPERFSLHQPGGGDSPGLHWPGIVRDVVYAGSVFAHTVVLPGDTVVEVHNLEAWVAGSTVTVCVDERHVRLLPVPHQRDGESMTPSAPAT